MRCPCFYARRCALVMVIIVLVTGLPQAYRQAHAAEPERCEQRTDVAIWTAPTTPTAGKPLRVMVVTTKAVAFDLAISDPEGRNLFLATTARGGPPWSYVGSINEPATGAYRIEALSDTKRVACLTVNVADGATGAGKAGAKGISRYGLWDRRTEAYFSAWVEMLFDTPVEESLELPSLEPLLRDPERNFLNGHLGNDEDKALPAQPDCADLPYYLRAYFAWKIGLPMPARACGRGSANKPPRCNPSVIERRFSTAAATVNEFRRYAAKLMDLVQSGNARTGLDDDATDFYPIALDREQLWPGSIFADPYGHTLVIVKWVPQTETHSGLLLAADAQPDNSVARKRFWEGTFLFDGELPGAGPGFKAFRPAVADPSGKSIGLPGNTALAADNEFRPYSLDQAGMAKDVFYARMTRLVNPNGLDPVAAYEAMLSALVEQLETRVKSVDNATEYQRSHAQALIPMPDGAAIFETTGPWEDFSTPSRDMRLLIALDVLVRLPDRIVQHPQLFVLNGATPESAKTRVATLHARRIQEVEIRYIRSDGTATDLSVAEILNRRTALEMAYNPNDCVEVRWGAAPDSAEYTTCQRHAPPDQVQKMQKYREWFREGRRPAR